ncbi:hypothetical protein PSEUBRA_003714 [Kalmanozyma brasiliensis GHG001]|uniref:uncharacterized protein n=1 Tax=Kalmanozyma brasiliensis (strain GHG001) TaxID=1365824 RepID=UPI00286812B4|nr:uncharacterized protein PSEUBRA_003714 [Kalmanozyma brasiliensis GHG001]KAF6767277.1 hypothetical protein PSEUBRA_003714 [Kalmanozyma brasiliensis GHG001]
MPPLTNQAPAKAWPDPIRHSVLLLVCIVIGGLLVIATLIVALAWFLRLTCCARERRARCERKVESTSQTPSAIEGGQPLDDCHSLDSVTVVDDDHVEDKDAKSDAPKQDTRQYVPMRTYAGAEAAASAPQSTWNGRGWTLFDPPVPALQLPRPVARSGGDYRAKKEPLVERSVEDLLWPASIKRRPSYIERLAQRHHLLPRHASTAPPFKPAMEEDRRSRLVDSVYRWLGQVTEASEAVYPHAALSPLSGSRSHKHGSMRSAYTSTTLAETVSETSFATQAGTAGVRKSERLIERIDADYDHQQRRGTTAAIDLASRNAPAVVSRAPSIRPQFFTTTTLASWLEPA